MERRGTILDIVLTCALLAAGCSGHDIRNPENPVTEVSVEFTLCGMDSKSTGDGHAAPEEISLLVFDCYGNAEYNLFLEDGATRQTLELISGEEYSFYACADFGYQVCADKVSEMHELTYSFTRFTNNRTGRPPRYASLMDITVEDGMNLEMELKNIWAKVSVRMDRSMLNDDVSMKVTGVDICGCPIYVPVFHEDNDNDASLRDISVPGSQVDALENGDLIDLYIPGLPSDIGEAGQCPHLEIKSDYMSRHMFTSGGPLTYRFHIGDSLRCRGPERNTHYSMTVCPVGDGLTSEGWRVDKTYLHEFGPSRFASFPDSHIRGNIGDTLHLWCEFYPPNAPFDVGLEELEFDKSNGIYDYIIDEDGHGVILILTGSGTGIVYMEAGDPVNEAAMWVVEVNLPESQKEIKDTSPYMIHDMTSTAPESLQRQDVHLRHRPPALDRSPSPPHV